MTKQHFIAAAKQVRAMLESDAPGPFFEISTADGGNLDVRYACAMLVAGAYADLFGCYNDRFDRERFYVACGITTDPPAVYAPIARFQRRTQ
jgi:hypothetical protein